MESAESGFAERDAMRAIPPNKAISAQGSNVVSLHSPARMNSRHF
jgi:hypothetical protein